MNLKELEWSKENLPDMSSMEKQNIVPPKKKVARRDKVKMT